MEDGLGVVRLTFELMDEKINFSSISMQLIHQRRVHDDDSDEHQVKQRI
jgi:hypothetical protein